MSGGTAAKEDELIAGERVHRLTDGRRREGHPGSVPSRRWWGWLSMAFAVAAMAVGVHADAGLVLAGGMITAACAAHMLATDGDGTDPSIEGRYGD